MFNWIMRGVVLAGFVVLAFVLTDANGNHIYTWQKIVIIIGGGIIALSTKAEE